MNAAFAHRVPVAFAQPASIGFLCRGRLHVERFDLRRRRQLIRDTVGQFHARHRRTDEALRENALAEIGHREVEPQLPRVRVGPFFDETDALGGGRRGFFRNDDRDRVT